MPAPVVLASKSIAGVLFYGRFKVYLSSCYVTGDTINAESGDILKSTSLLGQAGRGYNGWHSGILEGDLEGQ
jgi:hypothetical protein